MRAIAGVIALSLLGACQQKAERDAEGENAAPSGAPAPAAIPNAVAVNETARLAEPSGPIDPKSPEAAGQVVQHFAALIEQNRFAEAEKLWSDATTADAFTKDLHPSTHTEIGELGQLEGAAGSIYTTVPVVFYSGTFRRKANVILRRVNDVPGSTEEQRRWHIERIEWNA